MTQISLRHLNPQKITMEDSMAGGGRLIDLREHGPRNKQRGPRNKPRVGPCACERGL